MQNVQITTKWILISFLLGGCQTPNLAKFEQPENLPEHWYAEFKQNEQALTGERLKLKMDLPIPLLNLLEHAQQNNQDINQAQLDLEKANAQLKRAGAALWPELDLSAGAGRSGNTASQAAPENSFSLGLTASYDIDIWGKISDAEKIAQLSLKQSELALADVSLHLDAQIADLWYQKAAAQALVDLYQKRVSNVQNNLSTIENGYQTGVSAAVDVYLTRNTLASEQSSLLAQQNQLQDLHRQLNLLTGEYPNHEVVGDAVLKMPEVQVPKKIPVEWVTERPDVQQAWLNILSKSAELAIAHKNRFPSFFLSASVTDSETRLADLLTGGFAWSIAASISQPIFDAGSLKAAESIAKSSLKQAEYAYVKTVYQACLEVENLLADIDTLAARLAFAKLSLQNAENAEKLSFNQYLSGISNYTAYLEAQRRLYSAQASYIELNRQYISAYIYLIQSLGGQQGITSPELRSPA
ncbi:efflux transporter outer membrane subunit [Gayadomonas joobiniege]|uniref:efflux transporter outer membrane subunit n=1 Tax=Gayadomonas joobiniege TaxID=1234606 RepID=UPI000370491F|nr:efflux transporter outer membrane subunit [Gayadomonas joobiniege]